MTAEIEGTPALAVMTSNFESAARITARMMGVPDYAFMLIDHPVSSAADDALAARATATLETLARTLEAG